MGVSQKALLLLKPLQPTSRTELKANTPADGVSIQSREEAQRAVRSHVYSLPFTTRRNVEDSVLDAARLFCQHVRCPFPTQHTVDLSGEPPECSLHKPIIFSELSVLVQALPIHHLLEAWTVILF